MQPVVKHGPDRAAVEASLRGLLSLDTTRAQHVDGAADAGRINPDSWTLDQYWLDQPGRDQVMLDLLFDYQSNVALYPAWQRWLRERKPPVLLPWRRNDAFFPEAGARAYLDDVPDTEMHLLDGEHFVLDEYPDTVAELIRGFITRHAGTKNKAAA